MQYNFDVLRCEFREEQSYLVTDYVSGLPFVEYIQKHPHQEKEQILTWLQQIKKQADDLTKLGKQDFMISPFHLILTSDQRVAFLDYRARVNQRYLKSLTDNSLVKHFSEQQATVLEWTIQFLLSHTVIIPKLTYREIQKKISIKRRKLKKRYFLFVFVVLSFAFAIPRPAVAPKDNIPITSLEVDSQMNDMVERMREICVNENLSTEEKAERLMEVLRERDEFAMSQRFQMLQREYGFYMKGGVICFER